MEKTARILVTGAHGMVGTHLRAVLSSHGYTNVSGTYDDLSSHVRALKIFDRVEPEYVFHTAAFVRGLGGNLRSSAFSLMRNTAINCNVIDACRELKVKKIVAMGTVAMYPEFSALAADLLNKGQHTYLECNLWHGEPHASEYGYGHAKRHMIAQLEAYKKDYGIEYACAISTNLYGPHDRFDIQNGHVIPSLVRKFYEAKRDGKLVEIWGDGSATRDFLYVKDAARALVMMMESGEGAINLATGNSHTIGQAVDILSAHAQYGRVIWDTSKPVGQKRRRYDVSRLRRLGFVPEYSLARGLAETYDWYTLNEPIARK